MIFRFNGGWHFLCGGITGIANLTPADIDLDNHDGEFYPHELDFSNGYENDMIEMQPAVESDCFQHFIIPHRMWKKLVIGREVKEGEYQYWNTASWRGITEPYNTIWDWVASLVEEIEEMAEKGEKIELYDLNGKLEPDDDSGDDSREHQTTKLDDDKEEDGKEVAGNTGDESKMGKAEDEIEDVWVKVDVSFQEIESR
jgi:hypothetical protein